MAENTVLSDEAYTRLLASFDQAIAEEVDLAHTGCILKAYIMKGALEGLKYLSDKGLWQQSVENSKTGHENPLNIVDEETIIECFAESGRDFLSGFDVRNETHYGQ